MNDKDKEAFEKWWMEEFKGMSEKVVIKYRVFGKQSFFNGWQAACEYKQKEIYDLVKELKENEFDFKIVNRSIESKYYSECSFNEKLQAENVNFLSKINLALFIMKDNEWQNDEGSIQYQVYKILEKAIEEL